jgi:hypothetical protein
MLPTASEAEQFRLAAYLTTIAIAWEDVTREPGWYVCIEDDSRRVVQELTKRYEHVALLADCRFPRAARMYHVPTGSPAFRVRIGNMEHLSARRARAELSYTAGGRWGQGWTCDFDRVRGAWRAVLCVQEWEA